jgi:hypothetical protein
VGLTALLKNVLFTGSYEYIFKKLFNKNAINSHFCIFFRLIRIEGVGCVHWEGAFIRKNTVNEFFSPKSSETILYSRPVSQ